jgi:Raf kinase inhibitor-like YbhB/YbcL family protein
MPWKFESAAFAPGSRIPARHTGDGEDLSPPLAWSEPPAGTKQLVLVVEDPDAPSPEPWVHWVLYAIPATARALPEGVPAIRTPATPAGALQGKNSWGTLGWRGPSPPRGHGTHRYLFRLYALDALLRLDAAADKRAVLGAIQGHVLAQTEVVGIYSR